MKKLISVIMALVCVAAAGRLAHAADNGTEFGVEDDLTVLGTGGTDVDPDMEVKGFTVFGATRSALNIPAAPGSIFARGYVEVSSGMYVAGGSTFTSGAYFTGVSSFSDVANIHFAGGTVNQVLKKVAGGGMVWGNDNTGLTTLGGARRLQMVNDTADGLIDSMFLQNAGDTNITMLAASSMTVLGAFGVGGVLTNSNATTSALSMTGATSGIAFSGTGVLATTDWGISATGGLTGITGIGNDGAYTQSGASANTFTGDTALNGGITLGDAAADLLTMNAQASFVGGSTFTAAGGGAYFQGVSSFSNVANIHIAGGTVNQVLKKVAGGGMVWGNDNTGLTTLGSARRLQMVNDTADGLIDSVFLQNAGDTNITMLATSSMTVLGAFGVGGAATLSSTLTVADNVQLGNATTDIHAINKTAEAGVALAVDSVGTSGNYAAKFYSGGSLAAWIKKK